MVYAAVSPAVRQRNILGSFHRSENQLGLRRMTRDTPLRVVPARKWKLWGTSHKTELGCQAPHHHYRKLCTDNLIMVFILNLIARKELLIVKTVLRYCPYPEESVIWWSDNGFHSPCTVLDKQHAAPSRKSHHYTVSANMPGSCLRSANPFLNWANPNQNRFLVDWSHQKVIFRWRGLNSKYSKQIV